MPPTRRLLHPAGRSSPATLLAVAAALGMPVANAQAQDAANSKSSTPPAPASSSSPPAQSAPPAKPSARVEGVTVTGTAPPVRTSIDRRSYSLEKDLQAKGGTLADALRNIPSVQVDLQGNVTLRGNPGVTILVDGNPSGMFEGEARASTVQQIPADRFERVEVITNPSAEFRAEGSAGIINLITKKATGLGDSGGVRTSVAEPGRTISGANFAHNSKGLTLSGDLSYRRDQPKITQAEDRTVTNPLTGDVVNADRDQTTHQLINAVFARGGVDYDVATRSHVNASARLNYIDTVTHASNTFLTSTPANVQELMTRADAQDVEQLVAEITGSWRQQFDGQGHELTVLGRYQAYEYKYTRQSLSEFSIPPIPSEVDTTDYDGQLREGELKADYTRPEKDQSKFKFGFDVLRNDNSYNLKGARGPALELLSNDVRQTNLFLYKQTLSQAYGTYEKSFGKLSVLGGVRIENDSLDLNQTTLGVHASPSETDLFPSLHLEYKLSDKRKVAASYSRRIQRPAATDLNPFPIFIDPFNVQQGNIRLHPQKTDSFEFGYEFNSFPKLYYAGNVYYRHESDTITDIVKDVGAGVFATTKQNLNTSDNGGLEFIVTGQLVPKVNFNVSGNAYWNEIRSAFPGIQTSRSATTVTGQANLYWSPTDKDLFQLNGFVTGRTLTPQGHRDPTGMLNLGYRHKFNDKISLLFNLQDALGTYRSVLVLDTPTLRNRVVRNFNTRVFIVTLNWNFGRQRKPDPDFNFDNSSTAPR